MDDTSGSTDDLLRPSISARKHYPLPPWNVGSVFVPAFFGGPVAAGILHLRNADRLQVDRGVKRRLWVVALAGVLLALILGAVVATQTEQNRPVRLALQAAGVITHLVAAQQLKADERQFQLLGREPESLVGPGIVAVVIGGVGCAIVLAIVASAVR